MIQEAHADVATEPALCPFVGNTILNSKTIEEALSKSLVARLSGTMVNNVSLRDVFSEFWDAQENTSWSAQKDLMAVRERDPACSSYLTAFLYLKGFQALQVHRLSHWLWKQNRNHLAVLLQNRVSEVFGVDIHPAAQVGNGIVIDHATNVVVGETAVLGDNVTMLQGVTLGGTGKDSGDRHPKVRDGVQIWAGAKILGNVIIGKYAQVGACSVVLQDVPEYSTVVGVPAKVVKTRRTPG